MHAVLWEKATNTPPDCSGVKLDVTSLWPPDHRLWTITASGATDVDSGDSVVSLVIDRITQDEPVNGLGDGDTSPDGFLTKPPSNKASVRVERSGAGDGRFYFLHITATDSHGATCEATRTVTVPYNPGAKPGDFGSAVLRFTAPVGTGHVVRLERPQGKTP